MPEILLTITETAEWFDTTVATVRGLIRAHKLTPKRVRRNGKAKGLNLSDLRVIARSLGKTAPTMGDIERFLYVAFGSVCSGIEAASVAWHPLGWRRVGSPRSTRSRRPCWPTAGRGCRTLATSRDRRRKPRPIDVLVGGTPCQSFSVAGSGSDWMTRVATWPSSFFDWLAACAPVGWCGRTSPASCRAGEDGTLEPSSGSWGTRVWVGLPSPGRSTLRSSPATPPRLRCRTSWRLATCRSGSI
jgi:hypothetical protein